MGLSTSVICHSLISLKCIVNRSLKICQKLHVELLDKEMSTPEFNVYARE